MVSYVILCYEAKPVLTRTCSKPEVIVYSWKLYYEQKNEPNMELQWPVRPFFKGPSLKHQKHVYSLMHSEYWSLACGHYNLEMSQEL